MFPPAPFVSFRSARNLESYFVRSKIYLERKVDSERCESKRCLVCLNVTKRDIFQPFQTKEQHKKNHQLNCNDNSLISLYFCKIYGLQYVGFATDKIRLRMNNYKEYNWKGKRGEEHMQPLVFDHFSSNDHNVFLEDCSITLIDKTDGAHPTKRKEYWRRVFKSVTPYGLNTIG